MVLKMKGTLFLLPFHSSEIFTALPTISKHAIYVTQPT